MVHLSEPANCENPNCRALVSELGRKDVHGQSYRLCKTCTWYAKKHQILRPAEVIEQTRKLRERQEERRQRGSDNHTCENPNCGERSTKLRGVEFEKEGYLRLCSKCYYDGRKYKRLRLPEKAEMATNKPEPQEKKRQNHGGTCENPDCRRQDCNRYPTKVEGKALRLCKTCSNYYYRCRILRTTAMVKKARERQARQVQNQLHPEDKLQHACQNPNCDRLQQCKSFTNVEGKSLKLCWSCRGHAKKHGCLRSAEMVKHARELRKRKRKRDAETEAAQIPGVKIEGHNLCRRPRKQYYGTENRDDPAKSVEVIVLDSDEEEENEVIVLDDEEDEEDEDGDEESEDRDEDEDEDSGDEDSDDESEMAEVIENETSHIHESLRIPSTDLDKDGISSRPNTATANGENTFPEANNPTPTESSVLYPSILPQVGIQNGYMPVREEVEGSSVQTATGTFDIPDMTPIPDLNQVLSFAKSFSERQRAREVAGSSNMKESNVKKEMVDADEVLNSPVDPRPSERRSKWGFSSTLRNIGRLLLKRAETLERKEHEKNTRLKKEIHQKRTRRISGDCLPKRKRVRLVRPAEVSSDSDDTSSALEENPLSPEWL